MGVKRGLMGIINTVWVFISLVIIPLAILNQLEQGIVMGGQLIKIRMIELNVNIIFFLGLAIMVLTALSYSLSKKADAVLTFLKYLLSAFYEYIWALGLKVIELEVIVDSQSTLTTVYLDVVLWVTLAIVGSILTGLLKAVTKYLEAEEEAEEKEEEIVIK